MKTPVWTAPALIMGLALMVAPFFLAATPAWTEADAKAREQTWANLHAAIDREGTHNHAHGDAAGKDHSHEHAGTSSAPSFAEAKAAHEAQQARFNAAVARPKWIAIGLRSLGILLAALGVWGYVMSRRAA